MNSQTRAVAALVGQIRPILAGKPAEIIGATLCDLLAIWLASHAVPGDPARTDALREELLTWHLQKVRELIPVNAGIIAKRSRKS